METQEIDKKVFAAQVQFSRQIEPGKFTESSIDAAVKSMRQYMDSVGILIHSNMDQNPAFQMGPFFSIYHVPREIASTVLLRRSLGMFNSSGRGEDRELTSRYGKDSIEVKVVSAEDAQSKELLDEIITSSDTKDLVSGA